MNKYEYIYSEIKDKIFSGNIIQGEKLESESRLMARYDVSRQTIRKALSLLAADGLIETLHGRGSFCKRQEQKDKRSMNIAVITTYITDYIFPLIIQGIYEALNDKGYSIILKNTNNSRSKERECLEDILNKNIDGLIVEPSKSELACKNLELFRRFDRLGIPYVFIQSRYEKMEDIPLVLTDDEKGTDILTEYLINTGHKNIAGVFQADITQGTSRHKGYAKTLQRYGYAYNPDNVIWFHVDDRFRKTEWAIENLIEKNPDIDAIVCYNDMIAYKVIEVLERNDKRVPEDISVTGFDAQAIEEIEAFKLTTVTHPKKDLGKKAAEVIIDMIDGREINFNEYFFEPELIVGYSTKDRR